MGSSPLHSTIKDTKQQRIKLLCVGKEKVCLVKCACSSVGRASDKNNNKTCGKPLTATIDMGIR